MSEDELYELASEICAKDRPISDIALLTPHVSEDDMLSVEPFGGDFDGPSVLLDKMVCGRKEYRCHLMGTKIAIGERHRCLRERGEVGEIDTFRFSIPALVLMHFGEDPTCLADKAGAA